LSGISVTVFRGAVAGGDVKSLSQISGVGKKTAERIIVELRDKSVPPLRDGKPPAQAGVVAGRPENQRRRVALMGAWFQTD